MTKDEKDLPMPSKDSGVDPDAAAPAEPVAEAKEPAPVAAEPAAVSEEPAAVSKESAAVSEEPAAVSKEPAAVSEEPAAVSKEPAAVAAVLAAESVAVKPAVAEPAAAKPVAAKPVAAKSVAAKSAKPAAKSAKSAGSKSPAAKSATATIVADPPVKPPSASPTASTWQQKLSSYLPSNLRESGIYIAFALIVGLFAILTDGQILQPQNLSNIVVQNSYILILAIGMILIIIAGHIDLSAGSVVAATGALSAVLMVNHDISWAIAIPLTLMFGAAIGAWQGYWIAYFGIPAFIVTLAGMLIFRAVTLIILGSQGIGPFPETVRSMANGFIPGYLGNVGLGALGGADLFTLLIGIALVVAIVWNQWRTRAARISYSQSVESMRNFVLRTGTAVIVVLFVVVQLARFKNLPWVLVLLGALVVGYSLLTSRAVFGRHIYAIGGNQHAATLSGVKVKAVTFWIFVNMGVLAAIAGIVFAGRLNSATPTAGNAFELDAIAAAFIGGAAVQGGVGKVVGAITGGLIMATINNGMSLISAPSERVMLVKGLVLLAAVAFDVWTKRRAGASAS